MSPIIRAAGKFARSLRLCLIGVGILAAAPASAQADLLVAPTRLVLDDRGSTSVILSNIGDTEATYRIGAELRRMTPEGTLEPVALDQANEIERAALEMVRFAPRRVVLPPGQPQSVRVSVRPAAELPDGEYRIHLTFNGIPDVAPVSEDSDGQAQGLDIRLTAIYGISIPVIVRKGNVESAASISNPRVETGPEGNSFLKLDMARTGNGSTFGELVVTRPGQSEPVYYVRGIAIYPELAARALTLNLTNEEAAQLQGNLRFEYREFAENGGALLASYEGAVGRGG